MSLLDANGRPLVTEAAKEENAAILKRANEVYLMVNTVLTHEEVTLPIVELIAVQLLVNVFTNLPWGTEQAFSEVLNKRMGQAFGKAFEDKALTQRLAENLERQRQEAANNGQIQ